MMTWLCALKNSLTLFWIRVTCGKRRRTRWTVESREALSITKTSPSIERSPSRIDCTHGSIVSSELCVSTETERDSVVTGLCELSQQGRCPDQVLRAAWSAADSRDRARRRLLPQSFVAPRCVVRYRSRWRPRCPTGDRAVRWST